MNSELLQFGGSLLAITALVALAHWLGFSRSARLESEEAARQLLALAPGGFPVAALALAADGAGAIARSRDGRLALLRPHGGRFIAQPLPPETLLEAQGETLCIHTTPRIALQLGQEAQAWAQAGAQRPVAAR
ncbi:hypothetical protein [Erythrobacter sp. EC-HK427]|uniref:hypothetical protein n=1 Tax=Erythrobacter sp. EC-HK427 TaxID=2038396 RepID=UPI00125B4713|nr:hypothetical protein [Erythrobacter sp. EC-HK427]VVT04651.1 conserved hypothetical protein [Erythrobacter sp. EC-HK427]